MDWQPGYIVNGKYRIESILGAGGFGSTYKVTHIDLGIPYVLKKPHAYFQFQPDYPKFRQRFIKEGTILAQLCTQPHPHIVRIFDLLEVPSAENSREQMPCLLIEFIPGMSLYDWVKSQGSLPQDKAVGYIRQIGDALTAIHKIGLVHWDVTPNNIMLRENGDAVLIDFGIAGDCPPTTLSRTFGNRSFAPCEQILLGKRTPEVDLYTLAASLYYAITGKMPTPACDRKLQNQPLIPPVQYLPTLDTQLNKAILAGMELEAENRPESVAAWLQLLETGEGNQPPIDERKYGKLRDLLAAGKWKEADEETGRMMLKVANREEEGWLSVKDIDNFPCEDLRAIDYLWVKYSNGRFGFSVQQQIYQQLGGTRNYDEHIWSAFGDKVGWRKGGEWLYYKDLTFSTQAPVAHLPSGSGGTSRGRVRVVSRGLFSRVETCKL